MSRLPPSRFCSNNRRGDGLGTRASCIFMSPTVCSGHRGGLLFCVCSEQQAQLFRTFQSWSWLAQFGDGDVQAGSVSGTMTFGLAQCPGTATFGRLHRAPPRWRVLQ